MSKSPRNKKRPTSRFRLELPSQCRWSVVESSDGAWGLIRTPILKFHRQKIEEIEAILIDVFRNQNVLGEFKSRNLRCVEIHLVGRGKRAFSEIDSADLRRLLQRAINEIRTDKPFIGRGESPYTLHLSSNRDSGTLFELESQRNSQAWISLNDAELPKSAGLQARVLIREISSELTRLRESIADIVAGRLRAFEIDEIRNLEDGQATAGLLNGLLDGLGLQLLNDNSAPCRFAYQVVNGQNGSFFLLDSEGALQPISSEAMNSIELMLVPLVTQPRVNSSMRMEDKLPKSTVSNFRRSKANPIPSELVDAELKRLTPEQAESLQAVLTKPIPDRQAFESHLKSLAAVQLSCIEIKRALLNRVKHTAGALMLDLYVAGKAVKSMTVTTPGGSSGTFDIRVVGGSKPIYAAEFPAFTLRT